MHEAAEQGDVGLLEAIVRGDPSQLRARDAFERTPLLWVSKARQSLAGRTDTLIDTDLSNDHQQAARRGHAPAVALLLGHAREPAAAREMAAEADHFGNRPLHVSAREGHVEVVTLLLARGADPRARNRYGWTALIAAAGE